MFKNDVNNNIVILLITCLAFCVCTSNAFAAKLVNASGKVVFLRLQATGGYGPSSDFIDGEVVIKLDTKPGMAFGMQLRNNNETPVREGMLLFLREAYKNDWTISIDYLINSGKKNGIIHRVWASK